MSGAARIAIVQRDVHLGASLERDAFLLARELIALGTDVHVYCNPATRVDELAGVTFHDVRPLVRSPSRVGRALELASFAAAATRAVRVDHARRPYDAVEVNGVSAWGLGVVRLHEVVRAAQRRWPDEGGAGRRAARAHAAVAHVVRPELAVRRAIQRLQLRPGGYEGVLAETEAVRDDVIAEFHVPPDRVAIVPLAVELDRVGPDARRRVRARLGVGADDPLLLFVGHAFHRKGLPNAIAALAGLPSEAILVVVGDGRDGGREAARRCAEATGTAERVRFAGPANPSEYYAAADVFVLPTAHDVWATTVTEAMAAGLPVVTTRAAGSARLLEQARAGVVLDTGAPDELRAALATLLAEPDRGRAVGERGRLAVTAFTARSRAELTLEAFERFGAAKTRTRHRGATPQALSRGVASFPRVQAMNPYQRLLYGELRREGYALVDASRFTLAWLVGARRRVSILHVHWPEGLYTLGRGPVALRPAGSWAKLGLFALRLRAARLLDYRIAWTVHQVYPHGRRGRALDRIGVRLLGGAADVLIAHDETTRERTAAVLGPRAAGRLTVVPHGSYVGAYAAGRSREVVRHELGIAPGAFAFLCFGELRAGKSWRPLVRAFRATAGTESALVVAGFVKDARARDAIAQEAAGDSRIRLLLRYVEDARVAELFGAADAAVLVREDGGTSGSLILPLSLGVPVVVPDLPAYRDLTGGEEAGWLYLPGDEKSLCAALERAASDPDDARRRGAAALERARRLRWADAAAATARLFREAGA